MKKSLELVEVFALAALCLSVLWVAGCAMVDCSRLAVMVIQ